MDEYIRIFFKDIIAPELIKNKEKFFSKAQLEYMATETNQKRLTYQIQIMIKALFYETFSSETLYKRLDRLEIDEDKKVVILNAVRDGILWKENTNQIDFYKKNILSLLETTEDRIRVVLDEIKTICEFDTVAAAIENCLHLSELPKRNRSAIQEEKRKFERAKERARKALKVLNLPNDIVDQAKFEHYEEWQNYESTLKHIKAVLYDELTLICGTGKTRAKNIVKIIEYI